MPLTSNMCKSVTLEKVFVDEANGNGHEASIWHGCLLTVLAFEPSHKKNQQNDISLHMRKATIWVSDQVRHKPACTVIEAG